MRRKQRSRFGIQRIKAARFNILRGAISRARLKTEDIDTLMTSISQTLLDYRSQFPEDTEITFRIRKHLMRYELRISIPGEKKSPYECGERSQEREMSRRIRAMRLSYSSSTQ